MHGYVDLHCHYLPAVDDGVRTEQDALALLRGLRAVGFDHVVATPHIRPAMFDNSPEQLRASFAALREQFAGEADLPETSLAAEHFFDDVVYGLLVRGEGLAYGAGRTVLVEFAYERLPLGLKERFFDLRMKRLRPVVAHPERYEPFWRKPAEAAESMRRAGGVLLLDLAALVGKYGSKAQRTAEALLEEQAYYAACSDAHRPADADDVGRSIERLRAISGDDEVRRLLITGPQQILAGKVFDAFD
ncbi:MAG: protein tyrosine phosphatase [Deltaproteobacteria bacterium]|nr:protein tyrosine phosphatase [Deltaproteobacteria bacterium]